MPRWQDVLREAIKGPQVVDFHADDEFHPNEAALLDETNLADEALIEAMNLLLNLETAEAFLLRKAAEYKLEPTKSFYDDYDIHPRPQTTGLELLEFCNSMSKFAYVCSFKRNQVINVKAPHRKKHQWDIDRGWSCVHGLTVKGCEMSRLWVAGNGLSR